MKEAVAWGGAFETMAKKTNSPARPGGSELGNGWNVSCRWVIVIQRNELDSVWVGRTALSAGCA